MQGIYDWLLDFCFYGFLDSIVMYLFIIKLFLNKKVEFKILIKHCLIISFGISTITSLVPALGLSQILMGIYIGICLKYFYKLNFFKSIFYGILSMTFLFVIEYAISILYNIITKNNILMFKLNNICRFALYLISKIIEIILLKGILYMKGLLGRVVRR